MMQARSTSIQQEEIKQSGDAAQQGDSFAEKVRKYQHTSMQRSRSNSKEEDGQEGS